MAARASKSRTSQKSSDDATEGEGTETDTDSADDLVTAPPEGFTRRNAGDAAGWVAKREGNIIYGMLLGRFARSEANEEGKVQHYYQLKLLQPCTVALPEDDRTDDVDTREAEKGEVVNLDENKGVEGLNEALKEGGYQYGWIRYVAKKSQKKNRSRKFWEIECYTQKRNAPF